MLTRNHGVAGSPGLTGWPEDEIRTGAATPLHATTGLGPLAPCLRELGRVSAICAGGASPRLGERTE